MARYTRRPSRRGNGRAQPSPRRDGRTRHDLSSRITMLLLVPSIRRNIHSNGWPSSLGGSELLCRGSSARMEWRLRKAVQRFRVRSGVPIRSWPFAQPYPVFPPADPSYLGRGNRDLIWEMREEAPHPDDGAPHVGFAMDQRSSTRKRTILDGRI